MKKKVLFLQNSISVYGGVWVVINTLSKELINRGYDVKILALRGDTISFPYVETLYNKTWEVPHGTEIISELKQFKLFKATKSVLENISLKKDIKSLNAYINKFSPDYIICNHYELLIGIPEKYLKKTINFHHASFDYLLSNKSNLNHLLKYNGLIHFNWLSNEALKLAQDYGFKNNHCIYNPLRYKSTKKSDVVKNKRLIYIGRFSPEKRVDLLLEIASSVLKKHLDWELVVFGEGPDKDKLLKYQNKQISINSPTDQVKENYLLSSISLNTSLFEGFCLTIVEAQECGVPTISFDFGDAVHERIENNKTGIIVSQNDKEEYINRLDELMSNKKLLEKMAKNCADKKSELAVENIVDKWETLFKEIEGSNNR